MISLDSLISEIYANKHREILVELSKYNLLDVFQNAVNHLNKVVSLKKPLRISAVTSSHITNINNVMKEIEDSGEKAKLKMYCADISRELLLHFIRHSNKSLEQTIQEIKDSLEDVMSINGYDKEDFDNYFDLGILERTLKSGLENLRSRSLILEVPNYYYEWKSKSMDNDLDDLASNLKTEKIISDKREFKKLFRPHSEDIQVRFDRDSLIFLVILFSRLHDLKVIKCVGKNGGKFVPLKLYGFDFDKNLLMSNLDPRRLKERIFKSPQKHKKIVQKVEKWVQPYIPE